MKKWKLIVLIVLAVLIVLQAFRPERNQSAGPFTKDISTAVSFPDSVSQLLRSACYDCHSNRTQYPWYADVQPLGWILAHHIKEGKTELNFQEFAAYSRRKQEGKLKSIANQVQNGKMPLDSYKWLHPLARLSPAQVQIIAFWANSIADSLTARE